jgi:hypothetical protein
MRELRCLKVLNLIFILAGINLVMPNAMDDQEVPFSGSKREWLTPLLLITESRRNS